jgi:signal transduction histidine kinase
MKGQTKAQLLLPMVLFCFSITYMNGQQSRVDSVVHMLSAVKLVNGLDTLKLNEAIELTVHADLSGSQIALIEKTADAHFNGENIILKYLVRYGILNSLAKTDVNIAIDYGKKNVSELKNINGKHANWMKDSFLKTLRLPYRNSDRIKEGIEFYNQQIIEAKSKGDSITLAGSYYVLGGFYRTTGLMDQAIYNMQKSISYMDTVMTNNNETYFSLSKPNNLNAWLNNTSVLGMYYTQNQQFKKGLEIFSLVKSQTNDSLETARANNRIVEALLLMDSLEAVPRLFNKPVGNKLTRSETVYLAFILQLEALYHIKTGTLEVAEQLLNECRQLIDEHDIPASPFAGIVSPDYYSALLRIEQQRYIDAIEYLDKDIERVTNLRFELLKDYKLKATLYQKIGDGDKAAETFAKYIQLQDAILSDQAQLRKSSFELEQQMSERELSIANLESENRIAGLMRNFTIGLAILLLALALAVYARYRTKQKDNQLLSKTLANLKSTQAQLIQSEKMASLGELTAGIAHEIQNPLNFVNNFSELNTELLAELQEELSKGHFTEVAAIANDLSENEVKITHHGKRADAIVKGMLAHSRSGKGEKQPTDINALAEEYLKLSYHGLRAKDKSFNADFKTDFDPDLPKVNVVPQDIGRVLLNLINNAFQACTGKDLTGFKNLSNLAPLVTVTTRKLGNKIEISVKDNGPGIPDEIKDKIFQPFFTTKPTGQGTGLGLSLSYDIVKAHGGELKVETTEGEGSKFTIQLINTI